MQEDPIGFAGGINFYTYCANNPILWIDPWGLLTEWKEKPWWERLEEGYYYGTGLGEEALEWYIKRYVETGKTHYLVMGGIASLWTPKTYRKTAFVLIGAYCLSHGLYKTVIRRRGTLGRDGAISEIIKIKSRLTGRTIKVIHRVIRNGKVIHRNIKFLR